MNKTEKTIQSCIAGEGCLNNNAEQCWAILIKNYAWEMLKIIYDIKDQVLIVALKLKLTYRHNILAQSSHQ